MVIGFGTRKARKNSTELFCGGYKIMIYSIYVRMCKYVYIYILFFPLPVVPAAR